MSSFGTALIIDDNGFFCSLFHLGTIFHALIVSFCVTRENKDIKAGPMPIFLTSSHD
jgi:hypothetical protein